MASVAWWSQASIRTLATVDVAMPDLVRPVAIVHRRHKALTPTAERFVQMLKDASEAPRTATRERERARAGGGT